MNKKKILQILLAASTFAGGMSLAHEKVEATEVKDNSNNNIDNTQVIDMARSILKGQVINAPTSLRVRADAGTNYSVLGYLANGASFDIKAEKGDWYRIDFNGRDGYVHKDYVKVLGSSNNSSTSTSGQKGQVINASVGLNVRQSASTSSAVLGTLNNGDNFEIIAKSGVWYNIKTGSLVGYVHGDYVKVLNDNTSTTPPTTNPSNPETNEVIAKGKVVNVPTNLRVRSQPNTSSTILGYLLQGNEVQITGESGSWYKINFNNKVGYVHSDYIQKIGTTTPPTTPEVTPPVTPPVTTPEVSKRGQVVNASVGLNIRQSASTSSAILGSLNNGATFEILGKSGSWYNIKTGSIVGYVHGDYVKEIDGATTTPPTTPPVTPPTTPEVSKKGQVVNASVGLNIRQSASTSSAILGSLNNEATFEIVSKSGSWYNIKTGSIVGYVHGDYVKEIDGETTMPPTTPPTTPEVSKKGQVVNTSVGLNIRKTASTSATVIGSLKSGDIFDIISKSGDWYNIKFGSITGYVHKDYVKEVSGDTPTTNPGAPAWEDKKGQVVQMSSNLRVRSEANTTSEVLGYLLSGDTVTITGESNDWYKINFNGKTGYVHSDYIRIIDGNSGGNSSTQSKFETILNAMKAHLGSPYVWGGAGEMLTTSLLKEFKSWYPNETAAGMYSRADKYVDKGYRAFDCSGLMQWGFKQAGVYIGRSTWDQIGNGREVHLSDIKPGDLLFYSNLQHVGMYIGNGQWIEAPNKNADVRIMNVPWNLVGRARRVLE